MWTQWLSYHFQNRLWNRIIPVKGSSHLASSSHTEPSAVQLSSPHFCGGIKCIHLAQPAFVSIHRFYISFPPSSSSICSSSITYLCIFFPFLPHLLPFLSYSAFVQSTSLYSSLQANMKKKKKNLRSFSQDAASWQKGFEVKTNRN